MQSNEIYLIGEVGIDITLQSVVDAVKKTDNSKILTVNIHSPGGSIYEGRAIYNYLKSLSQGVETVAVGMVASIASVIMLAGKKGQRYAYAQNNVLIHMPSVEAGGYAEDLIEAVKVLKDEEIKIANIYASETNFSYDEAISLMKQDRMMTNQEIEKFGLEIKEYIAVAKYNSTNTNNKNMNKKTQTLYNKVAKFLGQFSNKVVSTADGKELDFYELEDDAVVKVGDKAYYDGMDADGSFIMPDGETYVFIAGELQEIQSEDETDANEEALAEANATIALLTEQLEAVSNKAVELDTQNKANIALIAGYKASSKPAPTQGKEAPKEKEPEAKVSKASQAVANLNKNLTKK